MDCIAAVDDGKVSGWVPAGPREMDRVPVLPGSVAVYSVFAAYFEPDSEYRQCHFLSKPSPQQFPNSPAYKSPYSTTNKHNSNDNLECPSDNHN